MSITLRAHVRSSLTHPGIWFAHVSATHDDSGQFVALRSSEPCGSHPEAMQAAYKLLADLDAELMAEVHASRASRRAVTPKPCDCTDCTEIRRAAAALGEATA